MGLLSTLFGRTKLKAPNRDQFFSIVTAADSLQGRTDIRPSDHAGIVFSPVESTFFENLDAELRELLEEAGFARVCVYWEGEDEDGEGDGEFTEEATGDADPAWIAYVVAEK